MRVTITREETLNIQADVNLEEGMMEVTNVEMTVSSARHKAETEMATVSNVHAVKEDTNNARADITAKVATVRVVSVVKVDSIVKEVTAKVDSVARVDTIVREVTAKADSVAKVDTIVKEVTAKVVFVVKADTTAKVATVRADSVAKVDTTVKVDSTAREVIAKADSTDHVNRSTAKADTITETEEAMTVLSTVTAILAADKEDITVVVETVPVADPSREMTVSTENRS